MTALARASASRRVRRISFMIISTIGTLALLVTGPDTICHESVAVAGNYADNGRLDLEMRR